MKIKHFIEKSMPLLIVLGCTWFASCTEIEYTQIEEPAYLRVFNNLNYEVRLENRSELLPYLTMLIDPVYDENGIPVSAAVVGDFLDIRNKYAAPYPVHSPTSTTKNNPEYPGKENILVGPILNGFDLSSWAQVPSGKHRIVFMYRPMNDIPFFSLSAKEKQNVATDGEYDLQPYEIYTMHVLQKDFETKENGVILRQENFHKQAFSDSLVYFNVYNMSAKGFTESEDLLKPDGDKTLKYGIPDEVNVYLTLYPQTVEEYEFNTALPGYYARYVYTLRRDVESSTVNPYISFPVFADTTQQVYTEMIQHIMTQSPGLNFEENYNLSRGISHFSFYKDGLTSLPSKNSKSFSSVRFPSMIINTHSGTDNPRSFPAINTLEIVNGYAYLTTIQRRYDPPIY